MYWEGPVAVSGSHTGEGDAELTGYATSLEDRF
jgi:predicted secreted hydrolase